MRDFGIAKYRESQRIYRENGLRGETESCRRVMRSVLPQVGEALCKELEFYSHRRNNPPLFLMFIMDFDGNWASTCECSVEGCTGIPGSGTILLSNIKNSNNLFCKIDMKTLTGDDFKLPFDERV